MQEKIIGQMNALGFSAKEEATLTALTLDVVKSSEIEGELLNFDQVRSSIARPQTIIFNTHTRKCKLV